MGILGVEVSCIVCCSQLLQVWGGKKELLSEGCRNSVEAPQGWEMSLLEVAGDAGRPGGIWGLSRTTQQVGQMKLISHEVSLLPEAGAWCEVARKAGES